MAELREMLSFYNLFDLAILDFLGLMTTNRKAMKTLGSGLIQSLPERLP
jgi:hypothetical protein